MPRPRHAPPTALAAIALSLLMLAPAMLAQGASTPPTGGGDGSSLTAANEGVSVPRFKAQPVDANRNGALEAIELSSTVNFSRKGSFEVRLSLAADDGRWQLSWVESAFATGPFPASRYFEAGFEAWRLLKQQLGVGLVARVQVTNATTGVVVASAASKLGPYSASDLEVPDGEVGATVTGIGEVRGLDLDGNGAPDVLEVPVLLDVRQAATYTITLAATSGAILQSATRTYFNTTELGKGPQTVRVWVPGSYVRTVMELSAQARTGGYESNVLNSTATVSNAGKYETPDLAHLFTGANRTAGKDADGDRLFDALELQVGLEVAVAGEYHLTAILAPDGEWVDAPVTFGNIARLLYSVQSGKVVAVSWDGKLPEGRTDVPFVVDGRTLYAWGHDGDYGAIVVAEGPAAFLWGAGRLHRVGTFDHTQFEAPEPPISLVPGHSDAGVPSRTGEGLSAIRVDYRVRVAVAGRYTALGTLLYDGKEVSYAHTVVSLPVGDGTVSLTFPGEVIRAAVVDGALEARVRIYTGGLAIDNTTFEQGATGSHVTRAYSWREFAPPDPLTDPKQPTPEEGVDHVLLRTGDMVVVVLRDRPDFAFYLASDEGRRAYMRLLFTRLFAISDTNGDGAPQPGEVAYTVDLRAYEWDLSNVEVLDDATLGRIVRFEQSAVVDLVENDPTAEAEGRPLLAVTGFARVTLRLTLASRDAELPADGGMYTVAGGTELKVDVRIDVLRPVADVDFLTVEQLLRDDRGAYVPRPKEAVASPDEAPAIRSFRDREGLRQLVGFEGGKGAPGFYSWVRRADATADDGTTESVDVRAAYMLTQGVMLLYLSYPYDVTTASIYHDPSLGVVGGGLPPLPEVFESMFDPLLFTVSAVAAVAVAWGLRGGGRREDQDEKEEEEEAGEPPRAVASPAPRQRPGWQQPPPQSAPQPPVPQYPPPQPYPPPPPAPPQQAAPPRQDRVEWE